MGARRPRSSAPSARAPPVSPPPSGPQLAARGVAVSTRAPVESLERRRGAGDDPSGWRVAVGGERPEAREVDGVVLAVPAPAAAGLLAGSAPEAAGLLRAIEHASVALVTLALPAGATEAPLAGTGFLVPRTATVDGAAPLVTAVSYLGHKWPHLARAGDELVRVSVGRFADSRHLALDDGELVDAVVGELTALLGLRARPLDAMVTRHHRAFPQYRVGHLVRVGRIEQAVAACGRIEVAGAAYRGVGIPACIGSGRSAARRLLDSLVRPGGTRRVPTGSDRS